LPATAGFVSFTPEQLNCCKPQKCVVNTTSHYWSTPEHAELMSEKEWADALEAVFDDAVNSDNDNNNNNNNSQRS
jgi:hypothetical protein